MATALPAATNLKNQKLNHLASLALGDQYKDHGEDYKKNEALARETLPGIFSRAEKASKEASLEELGIQEQFRFPEDNPPAPGKAIPIYENKYDIQWIPWENIADELKKKFGNTQVNLFVDTHIHFTEILPRLPNWRWIWSRAVNNDPASKSFDTTSSQQYYEVAGTGQNTMSILQAQPDARISDPKMLFLTANDLWLNIKPSEDLKEPQRIKTSVTTRIDNNLFETNQDTNKARAISKQLGALKNQFNLGRNKEGEKALKKLIFLSKRHGDQAQALEFTRPIICKNMAGETINTANGLGAFVSWDLNACNSALSYGVPIVIYYNKDPQGITLFYNPGASQTERLAELVATLGTPREPNQFAEKLNQIIVRQNNAVADMNQQREVFIQLASEKIRTLIPTAFDKDSVDQFFKSLLKVGGQLAILSGQVSEAPLKSQDTKAINTQYRTIMNRLGKKPTEKSDPKLLDDIQLFIDTYTNKTNELATALTLQTTPLILKDKDRFVLSDAEFEKQPCVRVEGSQVKVGLIPPQDSFTLFPSAYKPSRTTNGILSAQCTDLFQDIDRRLEPSLRALFTQTVVAALTKLKAEAHPIVQRQLAAFEVALKTIGMQDARRGTARSGGGAEGIWGGVGDELMISGAEVVEEQRLILAGLQNPFREAEILQRGLMNRDPFADGPLDFQIDHAATDETPGSEFYQLINRDEFQAVKIGKELIVHNFAGFGLDVRNAEFVHDEAIPDTEYPPFVAQLTFGDALQTLAQAYVEKRIPLPDVGQLSQAPPATAALENVEMGASAARTVPRQQVINATTGRTQNAATGREIRTATAPTLMPWARNTTGRLVRTRKGGAKRKNANTRRKQLKN